MGNKGDVNLDVLLTFDNVSLRHCLFGAFRFIGLIAILCLAAK